jgi:hypothetical protein
MTFIRRISGAAAIGSAILLGFGLSAPPAQAAFTATLEQVGSNVVATGIGSIDLAGLMPAGFDSIGGSLWPPLALESTGGPGPVSAYTGFTGPMSFGSGGFVSASSSSGDPVAIAGNATTFGTVSVLFVPFGYTSGGALSGSATYDNATISSLGATPGTYVWTWGSGATADSFTLKIISPAPVPEPSSVLLFALPLGLVMLLAARRGRANA